MKKEETFFTLMLFGVVVLMVFLTFGYRSGARLVPLLVGLITLGLMAFISLMVLSPKLSDWYRGIEGKSQETLKKNNEEHSEISLHASKKKVKQREVAIVGWLLFLTGAIYLLGFLIAIPLFMFLFLKVWAGESWSISISFPGLTVGIAYLLFVYILKVPLHGGILF